MLITATEVKAIRAISNNISDIKRIDPFINEAEAADLSDLLGNALYTDVVDKANDSPSIYDLLLNGGNYVYGTKTYSFKGLKVALAWFSYARFMEFQQTNITPFGVVTKTNEFSQPTSSTVIAKQVAAAKDMGMVYWSDCRDYLDRNSETFDLWDCQNFSNKAGIRISAI